MRGGDERGRKRSGKREGEERESKILFLYIISSMAFIFYFKLDFSYLFLVCFYLYLIQSIMTNRACLFCGQCVQL